MEKQIKKSCKTNQKINSKRLSPIIKKNFIK